MFWRNFHRRRIKTSCRFLIKRIKSCVYSNKYGEWNYLFWHCDSQHAFNISINDSFKSFFLFLPLEAVMSWQLSASVCRTVLSRKQRTNTAQQHRTHWHSTAERSLLRHRGLPRSWPGVGQSLLQQNLLHHLVDREHQTFLHQETQIPISCGRRTSGVKV